MNLDTLSGNVRQEVEVGSFGHSITLQICGTNCISYVKVRTPWQPGRLLELLHEFGAWVDRQKFGQSALKAIDNVGVYERNRSGALLVGKTRRQQRLWDWARVFIGTFGEKAAKQFVPLLNVGYGFSNGLLENG